MSQLFSDLVNLFILIAWGPISLYTVQAKGKKK